MTISSRTPEGIPHECPVCRKVSCVEPSYPGGDACCPSCGHLLWWFRDRISRRTGVAPERISLSSSFTEDIGADSLDVVELIMELEEDFKFAIPDEAYAEIETVGDAIRFIEQHRVE